MGGVDRCRVAWIHDRRTRQPSRSSHSGLWASGRATNRDLNRSGLLDGSEFSELSVEEGARWSTALRVPRWIVQVVPPDLTVYVAPFESSYVHNLSRELEGLGSSTVEWELLHSFSPARAIIESFGVDPATRLDSVSQRGPAIPEIDS